MDIQKIEVQGLVKKLFELEKQLAQLKSIEKEAYQIKKRLKELYPNGYKGVEDDLLLEVKKVKCTQYDIPQEVKERYKVDTYRYSITVKKFKKN